MTNAQSKFKFKDLSLLAVFNTSLEKKALIFVKVGKTSAVKFFPSSAHEDGTLPPYVYAHCPEKTRLKKDMTVYPLEKRLLLSLDFHTVDDEDGMSAKDLAEWNSLDTKADPEPNPFKELPTKSAKDKIKVKPNGAKLVDPGVTAKACDAAEMELERYERGPHAVTAVVHPHPQPGTQDAGMGNPAAAKVTKKAVRKPAKVKKAVKGRK
jgi:hypothetical protein